MEELIDAVIDEFKREAEELPLENRVLKLYTYKMMIDKKVGQLMEKVSEESRVQQKISG